MPSTVPTESAPRPQARRRPSRSTGVRRRVAAAVTVAAVTTVLTGCATFTDHGDAARVGDRSLSRADLDELIVATTPDAPTGERLEVPLGAAQARLNTWILTEILLGELDDAGVSLTEDDRETALAGIEASQGGWSDATPEPWRSLVVEQQAALARWSALERPAPTTEELERAYRAGPETSGIACVSHILVDTEAEANQVLADLDDGIEFTTLAAERSIDTVSAEQGGALPCTSNAEFAGTYVPVFVDAAFAARPGQPYGPVESGFGFHVILVRPFDQLDQAEIAAIYDSDGVRFRRAARAADVRVDPRYGTFDPDAGVVTLG